MSKYFIEVNDTEDEGTCYVSYVNKNSWESKIPEFFTERSQAESVAKDLGKYIRDEYGPYMYAHIHFHVYELNEVIKECNDSINKYNKELKNISDGLTVIKSRIDKEINSGNFKKAHEALDDYESIFSRSYYLKDKIELISKRLDTYNKYI